MFATANRPLEIALPGISEQDNYSYRPLILLSAHDTDINGIDRRSALPDTATQTCIIHGSCRFSGSIELANATGSSKLHYDPSGLFRHIMENQNQ